MKFKNKGFTLIELLVVISIIGIITTLISANLNAARERGRDAERKSDLYNIRTALRLYYNDRMGFPGNNSSKQILGCGAGGITACEWGQEWISGSTTYMVILPSDPLDGQSYRYEVGTDNESFTLLSCLENKSDDKGVSTSDVSWCSTGWMYQLIQ